jgi:hypothetical protein
MGLAKRNGVSRGDSSTPFSMREPKEIFLRLGGSKLAVAMEMLNTAFLSTEGRPETVRSESEFGALLPRLKRAVQTVLGNDWKPSERASVYANFRALNRVPFDKHLDSLCSTSALSLSEADRRLFVRCRNSLVHRGRFYCRTADEKMRQECAPPESPAREYFWLLHVMDRLFLRLLDYRGPMIDWSQPDNPTRRDTF